MRVLWRKIEKYYSGGRAAAAAGYTFIFFISLFLTLLTFLKKTNLSCHNKFIYVAFFRFLHFYLFIYNSFFIFLFEINSIDSLFYLFEILLMLITWHVLELCPMTYYEMIICDFRAEKTTFHPIINIIFHEWEELIMKIVGILVFLNVIFILLKNNNLELKFKIIYFFAFCFLFGDSLIKSRYNEQKYKEINDEYLILFFFTFSFSCVLIFLFARFYCMSGGKHNYLTK